MKKRSEGYFGLHFDFHASTDCTEVGKTVTEEMIKEIIEVIRPDYIQCDCKGHPGYSSYQTKVGNPAPGFVNDQLKIWRKVTKELNIPLIMHYSGVWDTRALELRPEWAATNEDGTKSKDMTSTFKSYVDELLIPQLTELSNDYKVDGVWLDGECWATIPDFDLEIISNFEKQYSLKLDKNNDGKYDKSSKAYREFLNACRKQFFKYLSHYVDELHNKTENFEIASNWAFSSHTPYPVCADVDFLSGDFLPSDSYNSARFEGRILCEQNKPWDLMAWGFYYDFEKSSPKSVKSPNALCREAAAVLPLGGGFQIYNTQNRDGSVRLWETRELKDTAEFVRAREPFLKGSKQFSNIGVLFSAYDMSNKVNNLFYTLGTAETQGAMRLVLDSAHTCGALMDHMLTDEYLNEKNIIILPEIKYLSEEIKESLLRFVETGGNLIVSGYEGCKLFEETLDGVTISEDAKEKIIYIYDQPRYIGQKARTADVTVKEGKTEILKKCCAGAFGIDEITELDAQIKPIITKTKYGRGSIVAVFYDMFNQYQNCPDFHVRSMMSKVIDELDTQKFIEYKGQKFTDIVTAKKDGKLLINLTNVGGIYSENKLRAYDEIQPLTNVEIAVKLKAQPTSVLLQPENKTPDWTYDAQAQKLTVKIDAVDIHTIIEIK